MNISAVIASLRPVSLLIVALSLGFAVIPGAAAGGGRKPAVSAPPGAAAVAAPPDTAPAAPKPLAGPARMFAINDLSPALASAAPAAGGTAEAPPPGSQLAPTREPFGLFTLSAPAGQALVKWRGVQSDMAAEREVIARCRLVPGRCASPAAARFIALVDDARRRFGRDRIDAVNRAVNAALRYVSDLEQHGVPDLWSAPLASLAAGAGDCEDYAIAKYAVLDAAGVAPEDLRLLLGRDVTINEDHAVLAVRDDGRWLILDNRHAAIVGDSEMTTFVPVLAIGPRGVELLAVRGLDPARGHDTLAPASARGPSR